MLATSSIVGFIPTKDAERARSFYETQLGLNFLSDDSFALVFDANGTTIRIVRVVGYSPAPFTILGWKVASIRECAARLQQNGIQFQKYPGLQQDDTGIWTAPGGTRVAWFTDPDGNLLSISEG